MNEGTGSAGEQLAAGLQENGRAYIIGRKTKGANMDADLVKLPTGAILEYPYGQPRTPRAVVIEGRGVNSGFGRELKPRGTAQWD